MKQQLSLQSSSSLFLDFLRVLAAFTVLYVHTWQQWFPKEFASRAPTEPEPGHIAVIVFFVLSGYVIAYTTVNRNRGPMQYAIARLSRLYSVLLPGLVITGIIEVIVKYSNTSLYLQYTRGTSLPRYILSGLFLNQIWSLYAHPPINNPLWSLGFEFFYYLIFGLFLFRGKGRFSFILPLLACLVAGPKILLLMPVWLLGYFAYRLPKPKLGIQLSWLLVFANLVVSISIALLVKPIPYALGLPPFYYANQFITDFLTGIFMAGSLWLLPITSSKFAGFSFSKGVRKLADLTFTIYVLHYPLLVLWQAVLPYNEQSWMQMWEAMISVLFISCIMGELFEKYREKWIQFFQWLLLQIRSFIPSGLFKTESSTR